MNTRTPNHCLSINRGYPWAQLGSHTWSHGKVISGTDWSNPVTSCPPAQLSIPSDSVSESSRVRAFILTSPHDSPSLSRLLPLAPRSFWLVLLYGLAAGPRDHGVKLTQMYKNKNIITYTSMFTCLKLHICTSASHSGSQRHAQKIHRSGQKPLKNNPHQAYDSKYMTSVCWMKTHSWCLRLLCLSLLSTSHYYFLGIYFVSNHKK